MPNALGLIASAGLAHRLHGQPTSDLLTQRLQVHAKTAWMLRSLLE
jgi:starvation-inducible DNA-binding protein